MLTWVKLLPRELSFKLCTKRTALCLQFIHLMTLELLSNIFIQVWQFILIVRLLRGFRESYALAICSRKPAVSLKTFLELVCTEQAPRKESLNKASQKPPFFPPKWQFPGCTEVDVSTAYIPARVLDQLLHLPFSFKQPSLTYGHWSSLLTWLGSQKFKCWFIYNQLDWGSKVCGKCTIWIGLWSMPARSRCKSWCCPARKELTPRTVVPKLHQESWDPHKWLLGWGDLQTCNPQGSPKLWNRFTYNCAPLLVWFLFIRGIWREWGALRTALHTFTIWSTAGNKTQVQAITPGTICMKIVLYQQETVSPNGILNTWKGRRSNCLPSPNDTSVLKTVQIVSDSQLQLKPIIYCMLRPNRKGKGLSPP